LGAAAANQTLRKLKRALAIGVPSTSTWLRSRVPTPSCSASRNVLSEVSNGGVPRSAMGSNPISAMPTASVATQFVPAISRRGWTWRRPVAQGPSPPLMVWIPSMIARWMGRAATRSATTRGTLYPGSLGALGLTGGGALFGGNRFIAWKGPRPPSGKRPGSSTAPSRVLLTHAVARV